MSCLTTAEEAVAVVAVVVLGSCFHGTCREPHRSRHSPRPPALRGQQRHMLTATSYRGLEQHEQDEATWEETRAWMETWAWMEPAGIK